MTDIHPIRDEAEYDNAIEEIEQLWGAPAGSAERDRLQLLTILVEAYERVHHAIEPPDPIEALLYAMEKQGLTRRDLEAYLGSRGRVTEILNRRRPLTIQMIRQLHAGLGIPAASLIGSYDLQPSRPRRQAAASARATAL